MILGFLSFFWLRVRFPTHRAYSLFLTQSRHRRRWFSRKTDHEFGLTLLSNQNMKWMLFFFFVHREVVGIHTSFHSYLPSKKAVNRNRCWHEWQEEASHLGRITAHINTSTNIHTSKPLSPLWKKMYKDIFCEYTSSEGSKVLSRSVNRYIVGSPKGSQTKRRKALSNTVEDPAKNIYRNAQRYLFFFWTNSQWETRILFGFRALTRGSFWKDTFVHFYRTFSQERCFTWHVKRRYGAWGS